MTVAHGRSRYIRGCRLNVCISAERDYQRNRYRRRRALPVVPRGHPPLRVGDEEESAADGRVASAVATELATLCATTDRPGVAQMALARMMDSPRAVPSQPAAAKVLGTLDKLYSWRVEHLEPGEVIVRR